MIHTAIANSSYGVMIRAVWQLAGPRRRDLMLVYASLGLASACTLIGPLIIGHIVETVTSGDPHMIAELLRQLSYLIINVIVFWVFNGPARYLERHVAFHVRTRMTETLYRGIMVKPWSWHQDHHSGATLSRVNAATQGVYNFADSHFLWLEAITRLIGSLALMLWFAPPAGLAYIVIIPPVMLAMQGFNIRLRQASRDQNIAEQQVSAGLIDYLGNIATVLTLRLEAVSRSEVLRRLRIVWPPLQKQMVLIELKWFVFVTAMEIAGVLAILFYVLWHKQDAPAALAGVVAAIFQYARLITICVRSIVDRQQELVTQRVSVDAVRDILTGAAMQDTLDLESGNCWRVAGIKGLGYRYSSQPGARAVLDDVSLSLICGKRIALVGESGSGKSTLLRILRGLHSPDKGELMIDGHEMTFDTLSHITTLVPQDPEIFENTLRYNITCGIAEDAGLDSAVEMACLSPVLELVPNGLDTDIRERGVNLSGGQKQRLALSRGLFAARDSSILLLDEPTSSLDPVTEAIVYDRIFAGLPDACIVSSVHRLHLLSRFDHIYVMDKGRIVEEGSFAELVARQGLLQRMWAAQQRETDDIIEDG